MTNYDSYEQDREDNAVNRVGKWDEDFGQREAYTWEWEPTAIERKNELIRAQKAIANYQAMNPKYPHSVTSGEWMGAVGIALIIIAILIAFFMIPPAHGQTPDTSRLPERLPAFENQFVWAQLTWDKSTHNCHIDAQPRDAGPGEMVGTDAGSCGEAERELLDSSIAFDGQTDSRPENAITANMSRDNLPDSPTPKIDPTLPVISWKEPTTPYWDSTNKILAASMVAVGSFDLAQTCHSIANGGHEVWMPMKSCGSLVGVGIAMGLGMTYLSYQLHRHGHHRLERIPFIGMIAGNTAGITYSKEHGAW